MFLGQSSRFGTMRTVRPPDGADYGRILRGPGYARWRSVLGIVLVLAALLLLTAVVNQMLVALAWVATGGDDLTGYARRAYAFELPAGMLAANLSVAVLGPVAALVLLTLHRRRPRWLSSVRPGLRWRYLLPCAALASVVFLVGQLLSASAPATATALRADAAAFLLVIVLTTPLQAAAEEVVFRGYLLQALGGLANRAWVGVVAAALVFAALHGSQNAALFADRLALGLIAGLLVWRTGGLEAAIAAHAVSNVLTYGAGVLTGSAAAVRGTQHVGWLEAARDIATFAVFTLGALLIARRLGVRRLVDPAAGN